MKGVSAVIAIILILMIVVALAALAWTWFSGIFGDITSAGGESVGRTVTGMTTSLRIDNAKCDGSNSISVTIVNTGTQEINMTKLGVYVDDNPVTNTFTGTLAVEGTDTSSIDYTACSNADMIRITTITGAVSTRQIS